MARDHWICLAARTGRLTLLILLFSSSLILAKDLADSPLVKQDAERNDALVVGQKLTEPVKVHDKEIKMPVVCSILKVQVLLIMHSNFNARQWV